jgi:hypothetical protein
VLKSIVRPQYCVKKLTTWGRELLEQLIITQLVKNFPTRYSKLLVLFGYSDYIFIRIFYFSDTCPANHSTTPVTCGDEQILLRSLLCHFLHRPVFSVFFGPNILLGTLYSHTLNLCPYFKERGNISHPYKAADITVV